MVALASLRTKVVRDLWWAATSPGLLVASVDGARFVGDDVGRALVVAAGDWLLELDADAAPLRAFLATADAKRLGFYFSALVEFWITRCPALGTRAWRLYQQLRHAGDARRVVGALKYVFACDPEDAALRKALLRGSDAAPNGGALGKIVCHWEASIKFFVYSRVDGGESAAESEDSDGLCDYVGPFLHENLAARVVTTKRKLQLCASRAVQAWLRKEILDGAEGAAPDECAAFQSASILRGYLFYHRDAGGADGGEDDAAEAANDGAHRHVPARYRALPGAVSLGHARGWWTESINGVPRPKQTTHWIVLSKAHWLCPARVPRVEGGWALAEDALVGAAHERACASISDLAARVSEHLRAAPCTPIMVACLEAVPDGSLLEASRGFVVPQEWDPAPLVGAPTWWRRREACTQPTLARMHMRGVYARPSDGADDDGDDVIVGFPRGEDDVVVARTAAVESAEELLIELQGQPSPHVKKGRSLAAFKLAQRCADLLAATEAAHGADRGAALVVESLALVANRRDMPVPLAFRLGAGLLDGHDLRRQSRGREAPLPEKVLAAVERVVDDAIETAHLELTLALRLGAHFGAARESPRRSAGTVLTPTVALDLKPRFEAALDASLASPVRGPPPLRRATLRVGGVSEEARDGGADHGPRRAAEGSGVFAPCSGGRVSRRLGGPPRRRGHGDGTGGWRRDGRIMRRRRRRGAPRRGVLRAGPLQVGEELSEEVPRARRGL
ncbi:hypothetical protein M885DRAFT_202523 [Pelagophyceae sp. CCMP2097]|nr:hypothetical protein M885DRAFT_202523 [Pelagophyceae sp. CCMP2097]